MLACMIADAYLQTHMMMIIVRWACMCADAYMQTHMLKQRTFLVLLLFFSELDAVPGLFHTKGSMANVKSKASQVARGSNGAMAQVVTLAIAPMLGELAQVHKQRQQ